MGRAKRARKSKCVALFKKCFIDRIRDFEQTVYRKIRSDGDFEKDQLYGWFGLDASVTGSILGAPFERLDLFNTLPTSTEEGSRLQSFSLAQNYPNPASSLTTIGYELPGAQHVRLNVYDVQGWQVFALVDAVQAAGRYEVPVATDGLPAGRYFYTLATERGQMTKAMSEDQYHSIIGKQKTALAASCNCLMCCCLSPS